METGEPGLLAEKNDLAILDSVEKINRCQSRGELKNTLESSFINLFEAQGMIYVWVDSDWKEHRLVDTL
ncbi:MAG: hypothetical protein COV66_01775 [Nitrospinae bacterium CG11_big_fil_rev_8_21_14_0_20_45_15]|nr:MAG: hypothetical protein COV66_01775 [Nitrospinae bacterium CG11_big_fil_rev_8_21_14_0_20_45_15]